MTEIPKNRPLRDRKYLNSFRDVACWACGAHDGTVVPAHIRHGHTGGMGLKPDDFYALPLCAKCHAHQHDVGERLFWAEAYEATDDAVNRAKDEARVRYTRWKEAQ